MSFWTNLLSGPWKTADNPGDPNGVVFEGDPVEERSSLPFVAPSPWDGWPAGWATPLWDFGELGARFNALVDIAWTCIDLNARVLSSMPVYRTRNGRVVPAATWMENPDPSVYSSWHEFAKQLFWDYQCGEAFVLPMAEQADGLPVRFRVIPPWLVEVDITAAGRVYRLGPSGPDVTGDILHIRYKSDTTSARGVGPLEVAGGRMVTAGVLARYVREVVGIGGVVGQTLETDMQLDAAEAQDLLNMWVETRSANLGHPPVLDNNIKLVDHQAMSPRDMAMIEIAQFTEGRIADLLGVPRALVGLPTGDTFTYSNVSSWFDHHDRTTLRPYATHVMAPLSNWGLPAGEAAELNRDEYTRPPFNERAAAWVALKQAELITVDQFQAAERLGGDVAAGAINGSAGRSTEVPVSTRELTEMIQKVYLGVGVVLSAEEARDLLNRAGADLTAPFSPTGRPGNGSSTPAAGGDQ